MAPEAREERRSFLNLMLGGSLLVGLGVVVNTVFRYVWPTKEMIGVGKSEGVTTISLADLPVGGAKTVRHQGKPYVVVRTATGIYAINAICTHLGCIVRWDPQLKQLACPCHAAFFDLSGNVISGPAPSPLPTATVKIVGDRILIT
ncbi:MAG: Rieske 2Fe-2S domain-containing protein [Deltaproteobacteria bacterium]|nr:Rieske 2Fe-2S domain-containing protein [Deltaproteobacteria bacterium]MBW2123400.1 Rieske 2Fe-2S domain-containing protein [Deltaproteobacteria bacterium]